MYKCITCNNEAEYPGECCNENMVCSACGGNGGECQVCKEDREFLG